MKQERPYDIKERTFLFGRDIVRLVKRLPRNVAGDELGGRFFDPARALEPMWRKLMEQSLAGISSTS